MSVVMECDIFAVIYVETILVFFITFGFNLFER